MGHIWDHWWRDAAERREFIHAPERTEPSNRAAQEAERESFIRADVNPPGIFEIAAWQASPS